METQMPVVLFFVFIFIASFVHIKADTKLIQVHSFQKEKFAKEDVSFSSLVSPEKVKRYTECLKKRFLKEMCDFLSQKCDHWLWH